jgi:CHASE2 domain-containing sensor protein
LKKLASLLFLLDSLVIGLGAFGHALQASHLHAALDRFPIEPSVHSMIYVVWYFVSGAMLAFGAILLWTWRRLRDGDRRPLVAAYMIGTLYVAIGAFGFVYRDGDPFMAFFVVLGGVLLASGWQLSRD